MARQESFSSSSFSYDVFLSFHGEDTRRGFTSYLYKALRDRGIHTFMDDKELQRGEEVTPSLFKAIEESRIAIIVFSQNYASSSYCLDQLVHILDSIKKKGRLVLPVFYDVDPSHVRNQRGSYRDAFVAHEERFKDDMERVQKWTMALRQAANLSGFYLGLGNRNEYEFIEEIVKEVYNMINRAHLHRAPLHVADYPVGLESKVQEVISLLNVESDGVHMIGIHGIGGIGKTTVARAVYNAIADSFEAFCFLENVREKSIKHGLEHIQTILISDLLGETDIKLSSVGKGIPIIKNRLQRKKVLLVLDGVDKRHQLQATVGRPDWFGSGSRIIITTRDKHLLLSHGVDTIYKVDELNNEEALKLLRWNAFKTDEVDSGYSNVLKRAVTYASGLPLALEVIGSYLFGKRIEEWKSALDEYERIPNKEFQKILIRQEAPEEPGNRLWFPDDMVQVLQDNKRRVWRFVNVGSSIVGFVCLGLSSSLPYLIRKWNWWKIFVYVILSIIIIIFLVCLLEKKRKRRTSPWNKAHFSSLFLIVTGMYTFFWEKVVEVKPDAYILISSAAFAIMSLSLEIQTHCGVEADLLSFFCANLTALLMKTHFLLFLVGAVFCYSLLMLRAYIDDLPVHVLPL